MSEISTLFPGLYVYEIVLLVLGVVFFAVLLFVLVYQVLNKRSINSLAMFFLLPIAMIGFPSIQQISYKDLLVQLQRQTNQVKRNPSDESAKAELGKTLAAVEQRPITTPDTRVAVVEAQEAVGERERALATLQSLKEESASPALRRRAFQLRERLIRPQ